MDKMRSNLIKKFNEATAETDKNLDSMSIDELRKSLESFTQWLRERSDELRAEHI